MLRGEDDTDCETDSDPVIEVGTPLCFAPLELEKGFPGDTTSRHRIRLNAGILISEGSINIPLSKELEFIDYSVSLVSWSENDDKF